MNVLRESWKSIAGRIRGLENGLSQLARDEELYLRGRVGWGPGDLDPYKVVPNVLIPALKECYENILSFQKENASQLPPAANSCIDRFKQVAQILEKENPLLRNQLPVIAAFSTLRSELNYYWVWISSCAAEPGMRSGRKGDVLS